jgi:hypothetical protein
MMIGDGSMVFQTRGDEDVHILMRLLTSAYFRKRQTQASRSLAGSIGHLSFGIVDMVSGVSFVFGRLVSPSAVGKTITRV